MLSFSANKPYLQKPRHNRKMYFITIKIIDDGINPSICYATNGGKIIIYSPHSKLFDEFNPEDGPASNAKFEYEFLNSKNKNKKFLN